MKRNQPYPAIATEPLCQVAADGVGLGRRSHSQLVQSGGHQEALGELVAGETQLLLATVGRNRFMAVKGKGTRYHTGFAKKDVGKNLDS